MRPVRSDTGGGRHHVTSEGAAAPTAQELALVARGRNNGVPASSTSGARQPRSTTQRPTATGRPSPDTMPASAVSRCAVGGPSGVAVVSLLDGVYHSRVSSSPRSSVIPQPSVSNGNNVGTALCNGVSLRKPSQVHSVSGQPGVSSMALWSSSNNVLEPPSSVPLSQFVGNHQQTSVFNHVQSTTPQQNQRPTQSTSSWNGSNSFRNPALPYHVIGSPSPVRGHKAASLPADRCQSPLAVSPPGSSVGSGGSSPAVAMSFFARAAQKLKEPSRRKKHRTSASLSSVIPQPSPFPTDFRSVIIGGLPIPRDLLYQSDDRFGNDAAIGSRVKVMLRVCPPEGSSHSTNVLNLDSRLNHVVLFDPTSSTTSGHVTSTTQRHVVPPKMFAFDAVFNPSHPLVEVCASGLVDIIQSVVGGVDGCLFCYGHARIGKTYTMLGVDQSPTTLGIIPCAIYWLFKLINDRKEQTGARFSVRVSAVEITGKQETLKDLLADVATASEAGAVTSPGVYLRDDPICGTQLENQSELRAPTAERAAYFLDAAIAARTIPEAEDDARNSHLLFTIHVYQYRVEKTTEGENGVAGGRSRLHLLDLGSCSKNKDGTALSLSALGTVLLALLNGQRHLPYRESKLTQLIKETLGGATSRACMIAHVSPAAHAYNETVQVLQLAGRVFRMRGARKKTSKLSSNSSEDSSSCSGDSSTRMRIAGRQRLGVRMGTMRSRRHHGNAGSGVDYTSSSEQSCDTAIYVGSDGRSVSDREITDCEGPPQINSRLPVTRQVSSSSTPKFVPNVAAERLRKEFEGFDDDVAFGDGVRNIATPSRMMAPGTNSSTQSPRTAEQHNGNGETWIDGPRVASSSTSSSSKVGTSSVEQWVDGPPEFRLNGNGPTPVVGHHTLDVQAHAHKLLVEPMRGSSPSPKSTTSSGRSSQLPVPPQLIAVQQKHRRHRESSSKTTRTSPLVVEATVHHAADDERGTSCLDNNHLRCEVATNPLPAVAHVADSKEINLQILQDAEDDAMDEPLPPPPPMLLCSTLPMSDECSETGNGHFETYPVQTATVVKLRSQVSSITDDSSFTDFPPPPYDVTSGSDGYNTAMMSTLSAENHVGDVIYPKLCRPTAANVRTYEMGRRHVFDTVVECDEEEEEGNNDDDDDDDGGADSDTSGMKLNRRKSRRSRKLDIEALMLDGNRESIYELRFDEELETGSRESLQQLVLGSDDDWSAWGTGPRSSKNRIRELDDDLNDLHCNFNVNNVTVPDTTDHTNVVGLTCNGHITSSSSGNTTWSSSENREVSLQSISTIVSDRSMSSDSNDDHKEDVDPVEHASPISSSSDHQTVVFTRVDDNSESSVFVNSYESLIVNKYQSSSTSIEIEPVPLTQPSSATSPSSSSAAISTPVPAVTSSLKKPSIISRTSVLPKPSSPSSVGGTTPHPSSKLVKKPPPPIPVRTSSKSSSTVPAPTELPTPSSASKIAGDMSPPISASPPTALASKPPVHQLQKPTTNSSISGSKNGVGSRGFFSRESSAAANKSTKESKSSKSGDEKPPKKSSSKASSGGGGSSSKSCIARFTFHKASSSTPSSASHHTTESSKTQPSYIPASTASGGTPAAAAAAISVASTVGKSKSKIALPSSRKKTDKMTTKLAEMEAASSTLTETPLPVKPTGMKDPTINTVIASPSNVFISPLSSETSTSLAAALLSPYHAVTTPRMPTRCSGSQCSSSDISSSIVSGHQSGTGERFESGAETTSAAIPGACGGSRTRRDTYEASSGYESMRRDSEEVTSNQDSAGEDGLSTTAARLKGNRTFRKKVKGRSRSAPARGGSQTADGATCPPRPFAAFREWITNGNHHDDHIEIKVYDIDDVEKMTRWHQQETDAYLLEVRRQRIQELLEKQQRLKDELAEAKTMLMVNPTSWSFDLHVAETFNRDDPDYLAALETETAILEKRVRACCSRIMVVTCFDVTAA